jgi:hypothetical protein
MAMRATKVVALAAASGKPISDQLRDIAASVRRIGSGFYDNPETFAIQKDSAADRLVKLARVLEGSQ